MGPGPRLTCLALAALLALWALVLLCTHATVRTEDNVTDPRTNQTSTWRGTLSCASVYDFVGGGAFNYDWVLDEDGTKTMQAKYQPATEFACAGKRTARAAEGSVLLAFAAALVGVAVVTRRRDDNPSPTAARPEPTSPGGR